MKRKLLLGFIITIMVIFVGQSVLIADDYTPPPGVLGPDEVDFGGETVTFVAPWAAHWGFGPDYDERAGDKFYHREERVKKAEELFNMKFQYKEELAKNIEKYQSRVMAGDSKNDIFVSAFPFNFAQKGLFYPVGEILSEKYYDQLPKGDKLAKKRITNYKGTQYSFGAATGKVSRSLFGVTYNRTILEEAGAPDISELYRNGEWTWNKMEEIAEMVTKDTNNDGEIDQWAMGIQHWLKIEYFIMQSNGCPYIKITEDGKFVFNWDTEEAIRAMNRMAEWYDKGWINIELEYGEIAPKAAMLWGHSNEPSVTDQLDEEDEFIWVPMPKGPDVEVNQAPALGGKFPTLPVNVENPKKLIAVYEYLVRPDDKLEERFFNFRNRDSYQNYVRVGENWQGEIMAEYRYNIPGVSAPDLRPILTGEKSAASEMDSIAPEIQATLNEVFGQ